MGIWEEHAGSLRDRVQRSRKESRGLEHTGPRVGAEAEPANDEELQASDEEEAENGTGKTKRLLDPMLPSATGVTEHQQTR